MTPLYHAHRLGSAHAAVAAAVRPFSRKNPHQTLVSVRV